jgi:type I restriction enzyme M protein
MEADMRKKMVEEDQIEAVIGLGPNLFYNSPMEAMVLVGNTNKSNERKGKVLFINAKDDVIENKGQAHLNNDHIDKIYQTFKEFNDKPHYSKVATIEDILANSGNMNISFYVKREKGNKEISFAESFGNWIDSGQKLNKSMDELFNLLK